jgi:hypothetical protein
MSLRKPLVGFPAAIEAIRRHRMATNETWQPTIGTSADPISGCSKNSSFFDVPSRNVYENKQKVDEVEWQLPDIHVEFIRVLRTFPAMCGQLRLSGRSGDRIKFNVHCAIREARAGGRARASARKFRAGGHDMYEKAGTYLKNAKLGESLCY